jgi:hypothetical protein
MKKFLESIESEGFDYAVENYSYDIDDVQFQELRSKYELARDRLKLYVESFTGEVAEGYE